MYNSKSIFIDDTYLVRDKSTSDGSQTKYNLNNKWYKIDNVGGEAESESLVSLLLDCSNLPKNQFVHYDKILINNKEGCVCNDFRSDYETEEFVTLYRLFQNISGRDLATVTSKMDYDDAINYVINFVKNTIEIDITTYLANTFYLDSIILNTDRHFNNYGIIMTNNGFKTAPIFDNGKALLTGYKFEDINSVYSKSFSPDFELNSNYLKKYRTLSFDKEKLLRELAIYPSSLQKKVLENQVIKLL